LAAELYGVDDLIHDLLAADAQLTAVVGGRIYADEVPQGAASPAVVYQFLAGVDRRAVGGITVYVDPLYIVAGVAPATNWAQLATIARRIEAVLDGAGGTVGSEGIVIQSIEREDIFRQIDPLVAGQTRYRRYGGRYRLFVSYT
jgi:hypothetical protein